MSVKIPVKIEGIFIPVEILDMQQLSFIEMFVLATIDGLHEEEKGGCTASNERLNEILSFMSGKSISNALTKLKNLGLLQEVAKGKNRILKAKYEKYQSYEKIE